MAVTKVKSIKKKVSSLVIGVSLISIIIVGLIAITGLWILRGNTINISRGLGETAASDSSEALETQMTDRLLTLAENMAQLSDKTLIVIQVSTEMIAEGAEKIAANPQNYLPNPVALPNPEDAGTMAVQLLLAEGINLDEMAEDIALMGNIHDLLLNIIRNNGSATANYIGSELGYTFFTDESPHMKGDFFDGRLRPWYIAAVESGGIAWTDVYLDAFGRGLGITCAKPYFDTDGNLLGVAGTGSLINELVDLVIGTRIGETGHAVIINEQGQIIISETIMEAEDGSAIRENLLNHENEEMRAVVENMLARESGLARVSDNGVERFIAYAPLETLPWSLAVIIDAEEVILPALEGGERIISMTEAALRDINLIILTIILVFAMIITLAALLIRHYSQRFANTLTKPITELTEGAILIGGGDLEHTLSIKTNDELETLAETFNGMIAGIKSITAEKERIGAELDVATKIQASMLPCIFPAFPGRNEFEIYASMQPAKEVGGDFYDFFLIDENTLAVVMADVSGKGVPAALFMVIAKTLLKNNAQYGKTPKEVFESVNNILCENNDAGMFVTAFMGYLDIKSGRFIYVNAGHNPPLIKHGKDNYDWLTNDPDLILAGIEGMTYIEYELDLKSGDELFLYTDGVTEAMNHESELFSDPRLLEVANENLNLSPKEFTERINDEIIKFADGAEQADDITMLVLKIKGDG